jgi:hypothetical protein
MERAASYTACRPVGVHQQSAHDHMRLPDCSIKHQQPLGTVATYGQTANTCNQQHTVRVCCSRLQGALA